MHALGEPSPLVRAHVAWAITQILTRDSVHLQSPNAPALRALLTSAIAHETDPEARTDLTSALAAVP